jgi:hypothetical protein
MQWVWLANLIQSQKPNCQHNLCQQKAPSAIHAKGKLKKEYKETVTLPPPSVPAVSSANGSTQRQQYSPSQYRQLGQPGSANFNQSDGQQRHTYCQQLQQAYSRSPGESQDEDEDDDVRW